ncbi:deoxyuridine 5'-triphosphate nucleotidohydrolase [Staphylococcus phage PT94]
MIYYNSGDIINNLKIINEEPKNKHGKRQYKCQCLLCGSETIELATNIKTGRKTSCGCDYGQKISDSMMKHGGRKNHTSEYSSWCAMKTRCYNKNYHSYHRYGGRGIIVCDKWRDSFDNFLEDMGEKPFKNYQLDRIDNNGNYEPSNCRWVSPKENSNNRKKPENKTGYTGIYFREKTSRFLVSMSHNRKNIYIGSYKSIEQALEARKNYIIEFNKTHGTQYEYQEIVKK